MPLTPLTRTRYPTQDDGPYGGDQIAAAALDLDSFTIPRFASAAERDARYTSFVQAGGQLVDGARCYAGGREFLRQGGVWVDPTARPMVRVRQGGAMLLPAVGVWYPVVWTAEDIDTHAMYTPGAGNTAQANLVVPREGIYRATAGASLAGTTPAGTSKLGVRVMRNNVGVGIGKLQANGNILIPGVECSGLLILAPGDLVRVDAMQDAGANWNLANFDDGPTFLELEWLRPVSNT